MTLTSSEARDAVMTLVDAGLAADAITTGILRLYDNVKGDKPGEDGTTGRALPFMRLTVRTVSSPQSTQGRRRFLTDGIFTLQIFTAVGDGHTLGDSIAEVALGILRGHVGSTGGVWFFDAVLNEIGIDSPWFQSNVEAGFRYQEVP